MISTELLKIPVLPEERSASVTSDNGVKDLALKSVKE